MVDKENKGKQQKKAPEENSGENLEITESVDSTPARGVDVLLTSRLEKLRAEMQRGYREFEFEDLNGDQKKIRIFLPSMKEDVLLSEYKSKLASSALKDENLMMREEVLSSLRKRGVWDAEKAGREKELEKQLSECINDIYIQKSRKDPDRGRLKDLAKERLNIQIDLASLREPKSSFEDITLENFIDREFLKYKMSLLVKDENGNPLWNDMEDYNNSNSYNKHLINTVLGEAYYFWAGIDPALFDIAPTLE